MRSNTILPSSMNNAVLNSTVLNSKPPGGAASHSQTYSVDFLSVTQSTKTYSIDFIGQGVFTQTYAIDFIGQGATTVFYAIDFLAATPYHDQAHWGQMIGNNIVRPIDPNRLATWSTYSRPSSPIDGMTGRNVQTGKIETWDEKNNVWKDAAGNSL